MNRAEKKQLLLQLSDCYVTQEAGAYMDFRGLCVRWALYSNVFMILVAFWLCDSRV